MASVMGLKHKIFGAILLATISVVAAMYYFMQWSFDRGFLNYVNTMDQARLGRLATVLEEECAENGDILSLQGDLRTWHRLLLASRSLDGESAKILQTSSSGPPDRGPGRGGPPPPFGHRPPPHLQPPVLHSNASEEIAVLPTPEAGHRFEPRVVLLDQEKNLLLGSADYDAGLRFKELRCQDTVAGYLGLMNQEILSDINQLRFAREQKQAFALIALVMLAIATLVSLPLANTLLRRLRSVALAIHRLASGRYQDRIPITSRDELGQLAQDINSLAMTLEKNEQVRNQWIADISHELRTPLSVLQGEIEALQDGVRTMSAETLGSLHNEVVHLARLVGDLYDLALSDVGGLTYRKKEVDLVELLEEVRDRFYPDFVGQGIEFRGETAVDEALVVADADRLSQLFGNLLSNSLKYTDAGGRVCLRLGRQRDGYLVLIEDSAPGVASQDMENLFKRLFRVESSRNRAEGGAGLGLAICRNIVEAHSGKIVAASSPLGGLRVTVQLPSG